MTTGVRLRRSEQSKFAERCDKMLVHVPFLPVDVEAIYRPQARLLSIAHLVGHDFRLLMLPERF